MGPQELADLIAAAKRRETAAFDALIDAYASPLFGYLLRLTGSRDDAEELLQEVFVRLVRTIGRYRHEGRFEAWLFRIATNLARDRVRRIRRGPTLKSLDVLAAEANQADADQADALVDPATAPPDGAMSLREDLDSLQAGLAQLAPAEREVLMLRHFGQLSFSEIAAAMNTPLGTALARAHRGLHHLREFMERDE